MRLLLLTLNFSLNFFIISLLRLILFSQVASRQTPRQFIFPCLTKLMMFLILSKCFCCLTLWIFFILVKPALFKLIFLEFYMLAVRLFVDSEWHILSLADEIPPSFIVDIPCLSVLKFTILTFFILEPLAPSLFFLLILLQVIFTPTFVVRLSLVLVSRVPVLPSFPLVGVPVWNFFFLIF